MTNNNSAPKLPTPKLSKWLEENLTALFARLLLCVCLLVVCLLTTIVLAIPIMMLFLCWEMSCLLLSQQLGFFSKKYDFTTEQCDLDEQRVLDAYSHQFHNNNNDNNNNNNNNKNVPQLRSDWISFTVHDIKVHLHSLICSERNESNNNNNNKPVLVWLHGLGSTAAISFVTSGVLPQLSSDFDIYCIDLPGFGRSTTETDYHTFTCVEIEEFMCDVLHAYLTQKQLQQVYLIGHSFGGYFSARFAYRYPSFLQQLMLVDAGGMFPVLGKEGAFVAVLFQSGFPMFPLRVFVGRVGLWFVDKLLLLSLISVKQAQQIRYWYRVQATTTNISDYLASRFMRITFSDAVWKRPVFREFLHLQVPVSLVFGEDDNIAPPHQGIVLSALSGGVVPVYVVKRSWHMPMRSNNGKDFVTIVHHAKQHASTPIPLTTTTTTKKKEEQEEQEEIMWNHFSPLASSMQRHNNNNKEITSEWLKYEREAKGYFSTKLSINNINNFYHNLFHFRKLYNNNNNNNKIDSDASEKLLKAPLMFVVDNGVILNENNHNNNNNSNSDNNISPRMLNHDFHPVLQQHLHSY